MNMQMKGKRVWWWLTLGCCLVTFLAMSQSAPAQERKPAAELIALMGQVEIKSPGEAQFRPAKLQDKLYPQDQIRTLKDSRAKLFFQDESILILSDDTTLDIAKFQMDSKGQRQSALIKLMNGAVRFIVQQAAASVTPNFEIQGTTAVMGIRGTEGIIENRSPTRIIFTGGRGSIVLRDLATGQTLTITPGQWVITTPGGKIQTGPVTALMRLQLAPFFRLTQSFVPDNVSSGGPVPPGLLRLLQRMGISFGNPLLPQTDNFRNTNNPSTVQGGTLQSTLPSSHSGLFPR